MMEKETAYSILQLPSGATEAEVRNRYQQLYTQLQAKITHAPTEQLRATFNRNLARLEEAYQTLSEGLQRAQYYPATEPVEASMEPRPAWKEPPAGQGPAREGMEKEQGGKKNASKAPAWMPISMILLLALASLFAILWMQSRNEAATLKTKASRLEALEATFSNGNFVIENSGDSAFSIVAIDVWYLNDSLEITRYKKEGLDERVEPRRSIEFEEWDGTNLQYGSKALFYEIGVRLDEIGPDILLAWPGFHNKAESIKLNPYPAYWRMARQ